MELEEKIRTRARARTRFFPWLAKPPASTDGAERPLAGRRKRAIWLPLARGATPLPKRARGSKHSHSLRPAGGRGTRGAKRPPARRGTGRVPQAPERTSSDAKRMVRPVGPNDAMRAPRAHPSNPRCGGPQARSACPMGDLNRATGHKVLVVAFVGVVGRLLQHSGSA